ncbi:MAG: aminodeoxychorismate/anthranilate synthase component II [Nitrospinae bacterium]|nr:aminodeoxychorismate/anthranilate synthase component II [Nitrospinota bacterium]
MLLMIDNYDSFTYNLVQYFMELGEETVVRRNDAVTVEQVEALGPEYVVISPGPCTPNEAGVSLAVVERLKGKIPILGVCLGHQSICQAFGGRIVKAERLMHGKTSQIEHDGRTIFKGIKNPFTATRYHSLVAEKGSLPPELEVSASDSQLHEIMAVRHTELPVEGVQFHPESVLTAEGKNILKNFLTLYAGMAKK